ncbi:MAG: hypothetical protein AAF721_35060 [Myxococcota bacterium]
MLGLLAVRGLDLAIFGTLGGLWLLGAVFIVVLYRWIRRFEGPGDTAPPPVTMPRRTSPLPTGSDVSPAAV